jgi:hypothetical protein
MRHIIRFYDPLEAWCGKVACRRGEMLPADEARWLSVEYEHNGQDPDTGLCRACAAACFAEVEEYAE